jgi:glucose-6-phosphate 1-dehydrogenase
MKDETTTFVIFGASGDLTKRKLIPALFTIYSKGRLPENFHIVGFARSRKTDGEFRDAMGSGPGQDDPGPVPGPCEQFDKEKWSAFLKHLFYLPGVYTEESDFYRLKEYLAKIEKGKAHRLYYLSTPPAFIASIVRNLGSAGMVTESDGWQRVIVEKPFGHDLSSAQELNRVLHQVLREEQIYRIDHYLGKETVQNVLVFRFGNTIFEPIWNRTYIDHVQITMAESVDVGHRAGYYDQAGVLRDMFQNHMLQLLAIVAMEPPASFDADAIRNEKVKLFSALRQITGENVASETVRGQYKGYLETEGVDPHSQTPTYAALRLFIDNWRWKGVPFYLRSGKALKRKTSEIIIQFKEPPHFMFPLPQGYNIRANYLALCVQPDEGIHLRFEAKVPDTAAEMRSVNMNFHYSDSFGACIIPEAYERLLLDALQGDASLFTRSDGIEQSWRFIDGVIKGWGLPSAPKMAVYPKGSWGPAEAEGFLSKDGREWLHSCSGH